MTHSVGIVGVFAFVLMCAVWVTAVRIKNAGIVDIAWAGGLGTAAVLYFFVCDGFIIRRGLIAAMAVVWGFRLAIHLYLRVMGHHPVEDVRYQEMRQRWTKQPNLKFFLFFQAQALLIVILSTVFLLPSQNPSPKISLLEAAGFLVWMNALLGESLADAQLKAFRANPANRGKVCQAGLWNYSRHPNYFFEWLVWVGFFLFALPSPGGWIAVSAPILMFVFLYFITGIPLAETLSLKSKGEAYRKYQETTNAFFPWFKPRSSETLGAN